MGSLRADRRPVGIRVEGTAGHHFDARGVAVVTASRRARGDDRRARQDGRGAAAVALGARDGRGLGLGCGVELRGCGLAIAAARLPGGAGEAQDAAGAARADAGARLADLVRIAAPGARLAAWERRSGRALQPANASGRAPASPPRRASRHAWRDVGACAASRTSGRTGVRALAHCAESGGSRLGRGVWGLGRLNVRRIADLLGHLAGLVRSGPRIASDIERSGLLGYREGRSPAGDEQSGDRWEDVGSGDSESGHTSKVCPSSVARKRVTRSGGILGLQSRLSSAESIVKCSP